MDHFAAGSLGSFSPNRKSFLRKLGRFSALCEASNLEVDKIAAKGASNPAIDDGGNLWTCYHQARQFVTSTLEGWPKSRSNFYVEAIVSALDSEAPQDSDFSKDFRETGSAPSCIWSSICSTSMGRT
jgi:hypothetical protein